MADRAAAGAVGIRARLDEAVLMDWRPGPSLGDVARQGDEGGATRRLGAIAARLSACSGPHDATLPDLARVLRALGDMRPGPDCPRSAFAAMTEAAALAHDLLGSGVDIVPLHGDLHHDNVRNAGPEGDGADVAYDAKGLRGDRAYELANAFRHPRGAEAATRRPDRVLARADAWSTALRVDRTRLLRWAAAKCALSIRWKAGPIIGASDEFDLLHVLLSAENAGG